MLHLNHLMNKLATAKNIHAVDTYGLNLSPKHLSYLLIIMNNVNLYL